MRYCSKVLGSLILLLYWGGLSEGISQMLLRWLMYQSNIPQHHSRPVYEHILPAIHETGPEPAKESISP
jgi:hypothetical protein